MMGDYKLLVYHINAFALEALLFALRLAKVLSLGLVVRATVGTDNIAIVGLGFGSVVHFI